MQHPDEGMIHAWLDGALSAEEAAAIESHAGECAECGAVAAEARGLIARSSRIVSALDSIPAGVIPVSTKRPRAWYATAQFRAAAAVLAVAVGTLVAVRSRPGDVAQEKQAVTTAAAPPATPGTMSGGELNSKSPMVASAPATSLAAPKAKEAARSSGIAGEMKKQTAASGVLDKVSKTGQAAGASRVETAAANAPAADASFALRQIKSDTTAGIVTTLYEVTPGVEVTLTDIPEQQFAPMAARKLATPRIAAAAPPPPPPAALEQAKAAVDSISWTDSRGRLHKLVGPVSRDKLEAIRRLLTSDKR